VKNQNEIPIALVCNDFSFQKKCCFGSKKWENFGKKIIVNSTNFSTWLFEKNFQFFDIKNCQKNKQ
jgi:hypothetical protein